MDAKKYRGSVSTENSPKNKRKAGRTNSRRFELEPFDLVLSSVSVEIHRGRDCAMMDSRECSQCRVGEARKENMVLLATTDARMSKGCIIKRVKGKVIG